MSTRSSRLLLAVSLALPTAAVRGADLFHRGDSNADSLVDVSDPIATLGYLFLGAGAPSCLDAADANDDGRLDLSDAVYSLAYLFLGGSPPPAPGPDQPGPDPTEDDLP